MAVALDISQGGILIESVCEILSDYVLLISVNLASNIIEIRGKVVHCRKGKKGQYKT